VKICVICGKNTTIFKPFQLVKIRAIASPVPFGRVVAKKPLSNKKGLTFAKPFLYQL